MNTATNTPALRPQGVHGASVTGILVDFKRGYDGIGNINLAWREFQEKRPGAVATEAHVHPHTVKVEGIDRTAVKKQTGLRLVTDREVKENRVQIIGLEGV